MINIQLKNNLFRHILCMFYLTFIVSFLTSCQNNGTKDNEGEPTEKIVYVVNTKKDMKNPWLAFRAEPSYDAQLISMLPDGTRLKVLGEDISGNFAKVEIIDNVGYVSKKYLSEYLADTKNNQDGFNEKYSKLAGKYIIGECFYTKHLTLKYLGNNQFFFKINVESCSFSGQFELINNIGISKHRDCDEIIFDFSKIMNWIDTQKGDSRDFPITVSVAQRNEDCINCHIKDNGEELMDIFPWGDYWKMK